MRKSHSRYTNVCVYTASHTRMVRYAVPTLEWMWTRKAKSWPFMKVVHGKLIYTSWWGRRCFNYKNKKDFGYTPAMGAYAGQCRR